MSSIVAAGARDRTSEHLQTVSKTRENRLRIVAAVSACVIASFAIGSFVGQNLAAQHHSSRGACIALEFIESFGVIGTVQKRQAMRAMTIPASRHHGLFPKTVQDFEQLCIAAWTTDH